MRCVSRSNPTRRFTCYTARSAGVDCEARSMVERNPHFASATWASVAVGRFGALMTSFPAGAPVRRPCPCPAIGTPNGSGDRHATGQHERQQAKVQVAANVELRRGVRAAEHPHEHVDLDECQPDTVVVSQRPLGDSRSQLTPLCHDRRDVLSRPWSAVHGLHAAASHTFTFSLSFALAVARRRLGPSVRADTGSESAASRSAPPARGHGHSAAQRACAALCRPVRVDHRSPRTRARAGDTRARP